MAGLFNFPGLNTISKPGCSPIYKLIWKINRNTTATTATCKADQEWPPQTSFPSTAVSQQLSPQDWDFPGWAALSMLQPRKEFCGGKNNTHIKLQWWWALPSLYFQILFNKENKLYYIRVRNTDIYAMLLGQHFSVIRLLSASTFVEFCCRKYQYPELCCFSSFYAVFLTPFTKKSTRNG